MNRKLLLLLLGMMPLALHAFDLRGFFTTGITVSDNENELYRFQLIDNEVSYLSDSVAGLQFDFEVSEKSKITMQAVARDTNDHFDVSMDWLYLTHELNSTTKLRGGRILLPLFSRSSTIDVGLSYPWIRPPSEVYELGLFKGMGGVDVLLKTSIFGKQVLLHPFAGEISEDLATSVLPGGDAQITSDELWGVETRVRSQYGETRISYMNADVHLEVNPSFGDSVSLLGQLAPPSLAPQLLGLNSPITADTTFHTVGGHYILDKVELLWEAANRRISFSGGGISKTRGYYVTLVWDSDKYQPSLTFARRDDHMASGSVTPPQEQDSVTVGIQHRLDNSIVVKTEITNIHPRNGTAGLLVDSSLGGEGDITAVGIAVNAKF